MINRLKLSIVLTPLILLLVIGMYVYSLWAIERKKAAEVPVDGVSMMMRDLLRYHEKKGGFPEDLRKLEGPVWEKRSRQYAIKDRAISHKNYYYLYTRISHHRFTLWAIPTGKARDEAVTWFLVVDPARCDRWKGAALPLEQVGQIKSFPSSEQLGILGLIQQPSVLLENKDKLEKSEKTFR